AHRPDPGPLNPDARPPRDYRLAVRCTRRWPGRAP
ncbi:MAG: hypothetical protein AVDCRST_MAG70-1206, partial [uncultured Thermomicrobiales bacterium]